MSQTHARSTQHVTPPTSSSAPDLKKQQAIQFLQFAQANTFYQEITRKIAGGLKTEIAIVFPDHLQILYSVTDSKERKLWNAIIAAYSLEHGRQALKSAATELVQSLVFKSSKDLLQQAYPRADSLFTQILYKTSESAMDADSYRKLYELSISSEDTRYQLKKIDSVSAKMVKWLYQLPKELRYISLAQSITSETQVEKLTELIKIIKSGRFGVDIDGVLKSIASRAMDKSVTPSKIGQAMLEELSFDEQIITDSKNIKYIRNIKELNSAAKRYENCLEDHDEVAASGSVQYYEWSLGERVIVEIYKRHGQWSLSQMRGWKNKSPRADVAQKIKKHLAKFGVSDNNNIFRVVRDIERSQSSYDQEAEVAEEQIADF